MTVIQATGRDLAVVVNQAVEQQKFSGGSKREATAEVAAAEPQQPEAPSQTEAAATEAPVEG